VYLPELHTLMLSDAHSDADLELVSQAFADSLSDMLEAGFFTI
jgi:glutamate-1-semialdehyde 2,1-aminomutase